MGSFNRAMAKRNARLGPRKAGKRRGTKRPMVRGTGLVARVNKILNGKLETKYVAEQVQLAGYVIPADIVPASDYHVMLPKLALQTGAATNNQREGDTVEPLRARISGHVWLDQAPSVAKVVYVKIFMVQPKGIKYQPLNTNLPIGLLDDGTADPVQWSSIDQDLQAFYPVNKENYTVMRTFTFKLTNNGGAAIGQAVGAFTNVGAGNDRKSFTYSWKPPTKLKYAADADVYPQNHNPIFFSVIYSPGFNCATDASLTNSVKMNWNIEMSYKDA